MSRQAKQPYYVWVNFFQKFRYFNCNAYRFWHLFWSMVNPFYMQPSLVNASSNNPSGLGYFIFMTWKIKSCPPPWISKLWPWILSPLWSIQYAIRAFARSPRLSHNGSWWNFHNAKNSVIVFRFIYFNASTCFSTNSLFFIRKFTIIVKKICPVVYAI